VTAELAEALREMGFVWTKWWHHWMITGDRNMAEARRMVAFSEVDKEESDRRTDGLCNHGSVLLRLYVTIVDRHV